MACQTSSQSRAIDQLTEVPEDLFKELLKAGDKARKRGQHRCSHSSSGATRLRLSGSRANCKHPVDISKSDTDIVSLEVCQAPVQPPSRSRCQRLTSMKDMSDPDLAHFLPPQSPGSRSPRKNAQTAPASLVMRTSPQLRRRRSLQMKDMSDTELSNRRPQEDQGYPPELASWFRPDSESTWLPEPELGWRAGCKRTVESQLDSDSPNWLPQPASDSRSRGKRSAEAQPDSDSWTVIGRLPQPAMVAAVHTVHADLKSNYNNSPEGRPRANTTEARTEFKISGRAIGESSGLLPRSASTPLLKSLEGARGVGSALKAISSLRASRGSNCHTSLPAFDDDRF